MLWESSFCHFHTDFLLSLLLCPVPEEILDSSSCTPTILIFGCVYFPSWSAKCIFLLGLIPVVVSSKFISGILRFCVRRASFIYWVHFQQGSWRDISISNVGVKRKREKGWHWLLHVYAKSDLSVYKIHLTFTDQMSCPCLNKWLVW